MYCVSQIPYRKHIFLILTSSVSAVPVLYSHLKHLSDNFGLVFLLVSLNSPAYFSSLQILQTLVFKDFINLSHRDILYPALLFQIIENHQIRWEMY